MEAHKPAPKYTSPKGMWASKLILRSIMLIFSITLLALAGSLMDLGPFSYIPFLIVAPAGFFSLSWNLAEGICIVTRGGHRGIHPGANVGLDLILWLGLTGMCVTLALLGVGESLASGDESSSSSYSDILDARDHLDSSFSTESDVVNTVSGIARKGQALLGIGAVLDILHFITFVIACYETNVRNRMGRRQTVVMVQNTPAAMQPAFYGQTGHTQPVYPQTMFSGQQQPVAGLQMYYPPAASPVFNHSPHMQPAQQALYPTKDIEAYQGQPSTPSPPPLVYPTSSPMSSVSELVSQKRN